MNTNAVAGCSNRDRDSSPESFERPRLPSLTSPYTRFAIVSARDSIDHRAQVVTLSNLATVEQSSAPDVRDIYIARQISASSTTYVNKAAGAPRPMGVHHDRGIAHRKQQFDISAMKTLRP